MYKRIFLKTLSHKKKLLISVCCILMFGLLLSAVIAFFHVKNWLVLAVKDEQLTIASVAQTTTEQWIASSKESMKTFAKKTSSFAGNIENNELLDALISQYTDSNQFDFVSISLEENGYYRINNWQPPSGYDPRVRPWYSATKINQHMTINGPYIGIDDPDVYYLTVSAPLFNHSEFIGVVSGDIKLTRLDSLFAKYVDPSSLSHIKNNFVIDSDSKIIAHQDKSKIGTFLASSTYLKDMTSIRLSEISLKGEVFVAENVMYAVVPIPSLNLKIVMEFSKDELNSRLLSETVQLLVHFLVVFILVVVALFVANKNVIKPLFNFLELDNETALPNKKSFKQIVCSKFLETETSGLLLIINLDYFNALTSSYSSIVVKQLLNQVKSRVENQIGVLGIFPSKVT